MATITTNQDGSLTVTLTSDEQETAALLDASELAAYLTQWLADKRWRVMGEKVSLLKGQEKTDVLQKLRAARRTPEPLQDRPAQ